MERGPLGTDAPSAALVNFATIFSEGERGGYARLTSSDLHQDAAGSTPVTTAGDPIGRVEDLSGNGMHFSQSTTTSRPTFQETPNRAVGDTVDDNLTFTCPTGGINGTGIFYTAAGAIVCKVNYAAGAATLLPASADFQARGLTSWLIIDRDLTAAEIAYVKGKFVEDGGVFAFSAATAARNFDSWQALVEVQEIELDAATNVEFMFTNCDSLTTLSDLNMAGASDYDRMFSGCANALTISTLGMTNAASGTNNRLVFSGMTVQLISTIGFPSVAYDLGKTFVNYAAATPGPYDYGSVGELTFAADSFVNANFTTFPEGVFDEVQTSCSFARTFDGCSIDQTGVNNILVSLDAAGLASVTIDIDGTNAAPSGAGLTAKSNLQGRGCTVNTN